MEILLGLAIGGTAFFIALIAPVLSLIRTARIGSELQALRVRLSALEQQVAELRRPPAASPQSAALPVSHAAPEPATEPPGVHPHDAPATVEPALTPVASVAAAVPGDQPPVMGTAAAAATAARAEAEPRATDTEGWVEAAIGGRLLLYAGSLAFVLGVAFFLKYAFDRNWITEWMRIAMGAAAGAALLGGGIRLARRYAGYGQMLSGAGLAVLYLTVYAAFSFYDLLGQTPAFVLLVLITAGAAWLSDTQRSQPMAIMAVGGGFLTPFLVGSDTDAQIALFTYVALLVAGTTYLARRRSWPLLDVLSYLGTLVVVAGWGSAYYTPSKYLRTTLFLTLFCGMFLAIIREMRRRPAPGTRFATVVLASAPVIYHVTAVVLLFNHGVALLVYLIACSVVGVAWGTRAGRELWRALLWLAVLLPLLGWIDDHPSRVWIAPAAITIGAIFLLHLLAQFDRVFRHGETLRTVDLVLIHLNGLGAFLAAYVLLDTRAHWAIPYVGLGLAIVQVLIARQLRTRDLTAALNALAVAFTLVAATIAVQFEGAWITAAWAAEGAAVLWVGIRVRRGWFRAGGAALLALAAWRWLAFSVPATPAVFRLFRDDTFLLGLWLLALTYVCAWLYARAHPALPERREGLAALLVGASVLTVVLLSAEVTAYWQQAGAVHADATFASGLSLSVLWAAYAGILVAIGIRRRYAPIRYFSMLLFAITICKVFLIDLSGLEGIYRVLGLLIVGGILLLVSFLYQRGTKSDRQDTGTPQQPTPVDDRS